MIEKESLPEGWRWVRFGDVVRQVKQTTKDPESEDLTRIVGLEHLDSESMSLRRWHELDDLPDGTSFTRIFRSGQVLFGKRRAYQRKVAVANFDGVCSGDILVFEPSGDGMLAEFLPYVVQSDGFFDHALGTSAGSLSPRTKWQELARYEFGLPPNSAQQQISELLSTLDENIEQLQNAERRSQDLYLSLGQSLLDNAHETLELGDVLLELIDHRGKTPKKLGSDFSPHGVPVISAANVKEGRIAMDGLRYVDDAIWERWMSTPTRAGDLLMTSEAPLGKTAVVMNDDPLVLGQRLFGLRVDDSKMLPTCLRAFLDCPAGQGRLESGSSGSTVRGIRASVLVQIDVPVPELARQRVMSAQMDAALAAAAQARHTSAVAVSLRSALRESLLGGEDV